MRYYQFIAIILVLFISSLSCGIINAQNKSTKERSRQDPDTWQWNVPDIMNRVTHGIVHSEAMNRDIGYNIFLPPSYHLYPKKRYSVVYYLHGAGGDEKAAAYTTEIIIPEIENGQTEEAIFVFLNGGHWSAYRDSEIDYVKPETYIIQELIPTIDNRYRTISKRAGRAIFGFSMGGEGALRFAIKYPDMFCAVGSISGALNYTRKTDTKTELTAREKYPKDNIFYWTELNQENIRGQLGIYLTVGGSEWLYDIHPIFLNLLKKLDIKFDYSVNGDLSHNWGTSKKLFGGQMIQFLGRHYMDPVEVENGH